jgi:hypothetical protein
MWVFDLERHRFLGVHRQRHDTSGDPRVGIGVHSEAVLARRPAITFVVNGYAIAADSATTFVPSCSVLKSGSKVTVTGLRRADGSVQATRVEEK